MRRLLTAFALVSALGFASGGQAAYDVHATVTSPAGGVYTNGGVTITMTGLADSNFVGSNNLTIASILLTATNTTPVLINDPYSITLQVTDPSGSSTTGSFTIQGTLSGLVSSTSSMLVNTFTSFAPTSQTIGGEIVTVSIPGGVPGLGFYTPPVVNGAGGGLGLTVSAVSVAAPVPEPSAVALMGIGVTGVLGMVFRRKLRDRVVA